MDCLNSNADRAWADTCRIVLGAEVGPIREYIPYLKQYVTPVKKAKSSISGKDVAIMADYPPSAKIISQEELPQYAGMIGGAKLNVNEIKDIDSILEALGERIRYSGNNWLGKSKELHNSTRVVDSQYVYSSHEVVQSRYIAYCSIVKYSKYVFGSENVSVHTNFAIKSYETYEDNALMACFRVYDSSHCAYSANLENCADCLFSFNLRSKRRCIGNLELPPDKFNSLKSRLLGEMREDLQENKKLPEIMEIIGEDYEGN